MNIVDELRTLTFGTELEYTGISRKKAANTIKEIVGGRIIETSDVYKTIKILADDGKIWKVMRDASLGNNGGCEFVTPVLRYDDIPKLQEIVRALRAAGAKTPECTSQHVHIGVDDYDANQIANIAKIFYKQEELILKSIGILESRLYRWARKIDTNFIEKIAKMKKIKRTNAALNQAWFGQLNLHPAHYDPHRYRDLNLNNIWRTGTIEFRLFNGTHHAGEVKAHIILCMAIALKGIKAKSASISNPRVFDPRSAKYDMRVFLLSLGLKGEEFKATRYHLLKRLPGDSSFKYGRNQNTDTNNNTSNIE